MRLNYRSIMYLSVQDLKDIITDFYKNQGINIKEIEFNTVIEIQGYGMSEHEVADFKGVKITTSDKGDEPVAYTKKKDNEWVSPFRKGSRYEEV